MRSDVVSKQSAFVITNARIVEINRRLVPAFLP